MSLDNDHYFHPKLGQHPLENHGQGLLFQEKLPGRFSVTDEALAVYIVGSGSGLFFLLVTIFCWGVLYYTEWGHVPCEFQGHCAL